MIFWNVLTFLALLFNGYSALTYNILIFLEDYSGNLKPIIDKVPKPDDVNIEIITLAYVPTQQFLDEACKRTRPDLILDFTTWKMASETAKKIAHYAHIPTITTSYGSEGDFMEWSKLSDIHKNILLQIKQPADLVPHIVRAIVKHHKYKNAAVIYDDSIVMLHKLRMLLLNMDVRHTININYQTYLHDLGVLEMYNFFIIGTESMISSQLQTACRLKFFKHNFAWYAITLEEHGNIKFNCSHAKYAVASPKLAESHLKVDFGNAEVDGMPRLTKEFYYDIVKIAYDVVKNVKKSQLKELCDSGIKEGANANISSSVKHAIETHAKELINGKYHINDLWTSFAHVEMQLKGYVVDENSTSEEHIADWTSENIAQLTNMDDVDKFASKTIYRIAVAIQEPFLFPDENSPYNFSGYCIDLIEDIGRRAGFTFELYIPEGSGFRYYFEMTFRDVENGAADIGLGPLTVGYYKTIKVDYSIPFYELVGMLIMMKIPESSKSFFKIVDVLDVGVWAILLLFFFITSFLIWIFDKFSPYSYQNNRELLINSDEQREFTLRECFWFCLTSVTSQGGGEAPRPLSGKIASGVWWLFGFLIVSSYTANLAAFLTISYLESSIESLEDLSLQYRTKYGFINGSHTMKYFELLTEDEKDAAEQWNDEALADEKEDDPKYKFNFNADYPIDNMYSKMLKFIVDTKATPNSLEEAIEKVQNSTPSENYAYIGDATDIKFAVLTNCDLQAVGEEFNKKFYSMVVKKESPLKEMLDNALMDMLNERKLESMKNKWWRENPKVAQCGSRRYQTDGITIQNVVGVFLLIGGGVVIALIIMGLDDMYRKRLARL